MKIESAFSEENWCETLKRQNNGRKFCFEQLDAALGVLSTDSQVYYKINEYSTPEAKTPGGRREGRMDEESTELQSGLFTNLETLPHQA